MGNLKQLILRLKLLYFVLIHLPAQIAILVNPFHYNPVSAFGIVI
jgi:hypothetical protein